MYDRKETTEQAAARLGLPELFTAMHEGRHVCIDGRHYNVSCLITDPDCDGIARGRMGLPWPDEGCSCCQTRSLAGQADDECARCGHLGKFHVTCNLPHDELIAKLSGRLF